jgi:hypothetical protein
MQTQRRQAEQYAEEAVLSWRILGVVAKSYTTPVKPQ